MITFVDLGLRFSRSCRQESCGEFGPCPTSITPGCLAVGHQLGVFCLFSNTSQVVPICSGLLLQLCKHLFWKGCISHFTPCTKTTGNSFLALLARHVLTTTSSPSPRIVDSAPQPQSGIFVLDAQLCTGIP